ncbi:MAG: hypothetical protein FJ100_23520 [Deltaproteobacteria bacterium]|nr:hypothetical protein [Deltaproteobacteria bacterium]
MYTMAFDSNGSKVWDHKPANKARATFLGVSARADGSFVGCGFEDAANTTWRTVSYNKAGQVVAEKMGDTGNAAAGLIAHSCLATADGGYWLVGGKWPEPVGNYYTDSKADGLVVRVNKDNVIDVQTTVGSPGFHEVLRGVALAPDGLVVAGHSAAPGGKGGTDIWVAKLDPAGKLVAGSERRYGGAKDDLAWAIAAVPGGTFAVVGRGHPGATPVPHGWFGHLDANLNLVCEKFPDLGAESHWLGVTYVSPGRMAMAGRIRGNVPTDFDASLAVVDLACNAKCADSGSCATTPPNACNDNDPCTLDACSKGVCSKTPLNCDDGNPCTIDSCKAGVGCVTKPKCNVEKCVGSVHEFADTCDANGICIDGGTEDCQPSTCDAAGLKCLAKCVPGAVGGQCDDGNACTDDRCANSGLACSNAAISGPCTDGNACTDVDVCTNGACKAGASKTCNDNIACTTDSCDAKTGACVFTPGPTCPLWDKGKWDTDKWQ